MSEPHPTDEAEELGDDDLAKLVDNPEAEPSEEQDADGVLPVIPPVPMIPIH